jgi:hypothetical protein
MTYLFSEERIHVPVGNRAGFGAKSLEKNSRTSGILTLIFTYCQLSLMAIVF